MNAWLKLLLQVLVLAILVLIIYAPLKNYVLSKIKISKWVVLALAILVFIAPAAFQQNISGTIPGYIHSGVFVMLFLWFMDLSGWNKSYKTNKTNRKDDIVIKPKAKPNRVKNKNK